MLSLFTTKTQKNRISETEEIYDNTDFDKQTQQQENIIDNTATTSDNEVTTTTKFPSLRADILVNNCEGKEQRKPFELNSEVSIDNAFFVGRVMLLLRPSIPSDDPDYRSQIGNNDKCTFVLRLQGRFKQKIPREDLMIGAQTTSRLTLLDNASTWTKGIVNWSLQTLAMKMNCSMTHSFGNDNDNDMDVEDDDASLPHISFPLYSCMNRVIRSPLTDNNVTNTLVPLMGQSFQDFHLENNDDEAEDNSNDEYEEEKKDDDVDSSSLFWDPNVLYSMECTGDAIDLANWKILSPMEMNLSTFWGNSPLRIVIYQKQQKEEVQQEEEDIKEEKNKLNYIFNLQLEHIDSNKNTTITYDEEEKRNDSTNNVVVTTTTSSIFALSTKLFSSNKI